MAISGFPKIIMLVLNIIRESCGANSNLIQISKTYLLGILGILETFLTADGSALKTMLERSTIAS